MRGGVVFYRGTGTTARAYLEADHSNADEYYLENGGAQAELRVLNSEGVMTAPVALTGEEYQGWVDWRDPVSQHERGKPRFETRISRDGEMVKLPASPRFTEMTVNVDKSLSVAAFMFPEVSEALDRAQDAAADAMSRYMARNSVTRVGPKGNQRLVPVERFEEVRIRHRTSRSGDPHRHLHVQWNTRVFAEGAWRGVWTTPTLKQQGALRGIGEAVISAHDELRGALAKHGLTFDAASGKVTELEEHSALFSKRHAQVAQHLDRMQREWSAEHPGMEPPRELRAKWQQTAWALDRPQKVMAQGSAIEGWRDEVRAAGLQLSGFQGGKSEEPVRLMDLSQRDAIKQAVARLEGQRSAWSVADVAGEVGLFVAQNGVVASRAEIAAWVERVTYAGSRYMPVLETSYRGMVPHWVRHHTSQRVLQVEADLKRFFKARGLDSMHVPAKRPLSEQREAARALGGRAPLVVVEGAAGSGKTTMLKNATRYAGLRGRSIVVVAPSLIAANEAAKSLGTPAWSAHKLLHEHGWRADEHDRWIVRLKPGERDPLTGQLYTGPKKDFLIGANTRIVVDEAGMVSQDIMHGLIRLADENAATIGLVGDRAQIAAVGRGGVLHMAVDAHPSPFNLTEVHRFKDPEYAELSLRMRDRENPSMLFDDLRSRGNIVLHSTIEEAREAVAEVAVRTVQAGATVSLAVDTNEAAALLNQRIQEERAKLRYTQAANFESAGRDGLPVRIGDPIMTRQNDSGLGVANREVWTVVDVTADRSVIAEKDGELVNLPSDYVREDTHLAYATTEHGVQGTTVDAGHGIVTDHSTGSGVYVSASRGREANTLHVIASDVEEARQVFIDAMERESGDNGIEHARAIAEGDLDGIARSRDWTASERDAEGLAPNTVEAPEQGAGPTGRVLVEDAARETESVRASELDPAALDLSEAGREYEDAYRDFEEPGREPAAMRDSPAPERDSASAERDNGSAERDNVRAEQVSVSEIRDTAREIRDSAPVEIPNEHARASDLVHDFEPALEFEDSYAEYEDAYRDHEAPEQETAPAATEKAKAGEREAGGWTAEERARAKLYGIDLDELERPQRGRAPADQIERDTQNTTAALDAGRAHEPGGIER